MVPVVVPYLGAVVGFGVGGVGVDGGWRSSNVENELFTFSENDRAGQEKSGG